MRIKVQAKGGQFDFECEDGENLLYAGLRQGIALPYECATGTCGTCRARVMDGATKLDWDDAPGLSYVKREKNELLMCRASAVGDCTLRVPASVQAMNVDVVPAYRKGRLRNVRKLTRDIICFDVAIDLPMTFHAGQFVVIETDEVVGGRAYSMVTYEPKAERLRFVVKRKPGGKFSDWLFDNHVDGKEVTVYGPLGRATFHPEDDKNVLCIAGGSGIAGMMSIIARGCGVSHFADHKGYVFFGVRTAEDVFFLDELSAYVDSFPDNLGVTVALSDEKVSDELRGRYPRIVFGQGFVHSVASEKMSGRYNNIIAYVAGPPPMVDGALRMLVLEARLPGTDIRYDKFS
jgi:toluene monooxygenase electron transfer component